MSPFQTILWPDNELLATDSVTQVYTIDVSIVVYKCYLLIVNYAIEYLINASND